MSSNFLPDKGRVAENLQKECLCYFIIFSGIIANRLKTVLDTLIHENQKGFLAGRFIGENTRLLYDIMHLAESHNIPGLVLLLDFEKSF